MIIAQIRTGRRWGNKLAPTKGKARVGSVMLKFEEYDHWDGAAVAGEEGEYIRATAVVPVDQWREKHR